MEIIYKVFDKTQPVMVKRVRKEEEQVKYSNQREGCKAAGDLSRIRISRCNGCSNDGGWLVNRRLISTPASVEPGSKKLDYSCLAPVESRGRQSVYRTV